MAGGCNLELAVAARPQVDRLAPPDRGAQLAQRIRDGRLAALVGGCDAVAVEERDRLAIAAERVQREQSGLVAALVERIASDGELGVLQCAARIAIVHGRARGGDRGVDYAAAVAPALVDRPVAVGLVREHLAGCERERVLEVAPPCRGLGDRGQAHELVEAREVEVVAAGGQGVGLVRGRDQSASVAVGRREPAAQHRDVGLERPVDVHGQRLAPDLVGQAILRERARRAPARAAGRAAWPWCRRSRAHRARSCLARPRWRRKASHPTC